ncbi:hypothetical protein ACOSQ4_017007 [Xanthoceras sorbifolium]
MLVIEISTNNYKNKDVRKLEHNFPITRFVRKRNKSGNKTHTEFDNGVRPIVPTSPDPLQIVLLKGENIQSVYNTYNSQPLTNYNPIPIYTQEFFSQNSFTSFSLKTLSYSLILGYLTNES